MSIRFLSVALAFVAGLSGCAETRGDLAPVARGPSVILPEGAGFTGAVLAGSGGFDLCTRNPELCG